MSNIQKLSILGAGGHAKVVIEAVIHSNASLLLSVYDKNPRLLGEKILNRWVIKDQSLVERDSPLHIAIGDNFLRKKLTHEYAKSPNQIFTIIHPRSLISPTANISPGSFIAAGSIVGPQSYVGWGAIVNHNAIVDHDCRLDDWCHIGPHATLGGQVKIGTGVLIGAGSVILPGLNIGDYSIVGAGSVVTKDVPENHKVVGVPARSLKE